MAAGKGSVEELQTDREKDVLFLQIFFEGGGKSGHDTVV